MAFRLTQPSGSTVPPPAPASEGSSSAGDSDVEDWASDVCATAPVRSLFGGDKEFASIEEATAADLASGFDLESLVARLALDFHQRVRLINYIRKESPNPKTVMELELSNPLFSDDSLLIPVIPDDGYLQAGEAWDSSDEDEPSTAAPKDELLVAKRRIRNLEEKLRALESEARQEISSLQKAVQSMTGLGNAGAAVEKPQEVTASTEVALGDKGKGKERDDDTHYFDSYAYNDIHEIMLKDTTRTKSYALFILSNPKLFKDAIVLDVGCGTGILSLLAARAGAKHVYAVDASDVAKKAIENIKVNGCADKITVVRGKVEDIKLPVDKVDIIISEWMGYFLLYESMLDSVLVARDRYLREGGVMAPSQTKIMLSGIDCADYIHDRIGFWSNVYGFDMRAMAEEINEDSIVEVLEASSIATTYHCIKDILTSTATVRSLDFTSSFSIKATRATTMHAFLGHFDTFFTPDGSSVAKDAQVDLTRHTEELKVEGMAGDATEISFTTGPEGVPTHWKQTMFLLKEPIALVEGTTVSGTFKCHKSPTNSRELDVEIHYTVQGGKESSKDGQTIVQLYKVR